MKLSCWWATALISLTLASCAQGNGGVDARVSAHAGQDIAAATSAVTSSPQRRFATLADRGAALQADDTRSPLVAGAHRWHPVTFSEVHALAAIGNGALVLPMADGTRMAVRYDRHVEHEDGNWTFVGTGPNGEDAVITFGAEAVFGSVQTRSGTLRLTTDPRGGWLVSSPPGADGNPVRAGATDMLIPPDRPALVAQAPRLARQYPGPSLAKAEAALADASTVVDVVVGFTGGFANARGGESAARTRVTNLVEISNQAYANSGISARLRLAHAMPVNFPDATGNSDAIQKLTGYKAGTGPVTVDPALQALRAAREQYHGDAVVLLRNFQAPENGNCGVAWVLGLNQSVIDASDADFAYSVVADGSDLDSSDGNTYFCREETFAHELGHNLGQVHNIEDSATTGAHPYAYGYRSATTSGFYTVMAYRLKDSNQAGIRYFSNPAVSYNGAPTGVANSADNVRSLLQTMPIIAAFRTAPVAPGPRRVVNDLDADGLSDMIWQGPGNGYFETWRMESQRLARALGFQLPAAHRVLTAGDLNGDRKLDLVVRSDTNALLYYQGDGITFAVQPIARPAIPGWRTIGSTDIDGDGNHDLLWMHSDSSYFEIWLMQGAVVKSVRGYTLPVGTRVTTTGDFAGDGKADVLVINAAREMTMWLGDGQGFNPQRLSITTPVAAGWVAWGDVDMNADGRADLLWSTPALSYFEWWNMQGAQVQRASGATPPADQRVAGTGDFNGDGLADMLLKGVGNDLHVGVSDGVLFNRTPFNIVAGPGCLPLVAGQP